MRHCITPYYSSCSGRKTDFTEQECMFMFTGGKGMLTKIENMLEDKYTLIVF
jgi:SpoU rRNA methylase family enzyme